MFDIREHVSLALQNFACIVQTHAGAVQQAVGFVERINNVWLKLIAFERDDIDTARPSWISICLLYTSPSPRD